LPAVVIRTLTHEYRLLADSGEVARSLAFIAIAPEIVGVELEPVDIPVEEVAGFLRLRLPDEELVEGTADHALGKLHRLIFADVRNSEPDAPFIHGATVIGPSGNRLVLVGHKACGKTTLTLAAMARGYRVEGDEHIIVRGGEAIVRPRTLRVKPGSLAIVPEFADAAHSAPFIRTWDGSPIYALNPDVGGKPWRIEAGRIDQLVFLEANHGGRSVMSPIAKNESFGFLMAECILPPAGVVIAATRLRRLALDVPAYRLQIGDLPGALRHLRHLQV
jgi:hypothetical protein